MGLWSNRFLSLAVVGGLPLLSACTVPAPPPPPMPAAYVPPPPPRRVVRAVRPRRADPATCTAALSDERKRALFRQFDAQGHAAEPGVVAAAAEPAPCRPVP